MAIFRPIGVRGQQLNQLISNGDITPLGINPRTGLIDTAGAGTWTGAKIATGLIYREGPGANYADTMDTAANIVSAFTDAAGAANLFPGMCIPLTVVNTVAFICTWTAAQGVTDGAYGGPNNIAASSARDYLVELANLTPLYNLSATTTNTSADVLFNFPAGQTEYEIGSGPGQLDISPGAFCHAAGSGITNSQVAGLLYNSAGVIGFTAVDVATSSAVFTFTFGPFVQFWTVGAKLK